jgi:UDP:flavonoid glycosyltransferase YjiC (YdhE family)
MHVLLIALGSHGDVHPFVGIGLGLRARGHRVRVVAYYNFRKLIEGAGLGFIACGSEAEYKRFAQDPGAWKRFRGTKTVLGFVSALIRPIYEIIREHAVPGETLVAASSLALGARVAQDHLKIPTVSVHLQPTMLRSVIDPPYIQGLWMPPWMPKWMKRAQYSMGDWLVLDRTLAPPLNAFRAELGLGAVKCVFGEYVHSPQRVIGLFPEWFAPPAPDWPAQVRLTGFPLYDETGVNDLSAELDHFLGEGEAPIAFTPGSAMFQGRTFFEESVAACEILGKRGLLLTRHLEHLPGSLPDTIRHVEFAPFSQLLPRCAALVHHGGIGTSAQALRAGTPQVVVPHAHDQPDNAARLVRLGVARKLEVKQYRRDRVATTLRELVESEAVRRSCEQVAGRFEGKNAIGETCDLIEQVMGSDVPVRSA